MQLGLQLYKTQNNAPATSLKVIADIMTLIN